MDLFHCQQVEKCYDNQPVVKDISLHLGERELVSLLGVSGVGKTTLFHVLAGVHSPDSGHVYLEGKDITSTPGKVSYMLQKDLLLPYKTILDNVSLPLILRGVKKQEARGKALELFAKFGLEGYEGKYPSQLSGGMRQRAALLRTYLQRGMVMLLDEPFSALDAITKMEMHRWYQGIMAELGHATLLVTHDIDEALILSDRIYILTGKPGQITTELSIPFPRPRTVEFSTSEAFMSLKRQVLQAIGA